MEVGCLVGSVPLDWNLKGNMTEEKQGAERELLRGTKL
jgi:hypothetical protein